MRIKNPRAGGIQIDGASGSENRYIIDGMDSTDLRSGTSRTGLLNDFVQEVQVKSSGYNAEYRAATGGVISALTKSGGNQFHGSLGSYFTNDSLQGSQRKSLRLGITDQTKAEQFNTPDDTFDRWEPVAYVGGPVLRDRAWFFAGYSPRLERTERTVTWVNPVGVTQTFVQDTEDHNFNYNVTTQALREPARALLRQQSAKHRRADVSGDRAGWHQPQHLCELPRRSPLQQVVQQPVLRAGRLGRWQRSSM